MNEVQMTTSKSTDVYHVTARVFLSNQPLFILEIHCTFVDCCKLENLRKAKLNTTCFLTESKGPWVDT